MEQLIILLAFFGLLWFVLIRPQQKKQREHAQMVRNLRVGDDVITIGGLHGTVVALNEDSVDLEVNEDTVVRFQRTAIGRVVSSHAADDQIDATTDDDAASQ